MNSPLSVPAKISESVAAREPIEWFGIESVIHVAPRSTDLIIVPLAANITEPIPAKWAFPIGLGVAVHVKPLSVEREIPVDVLAKKMESIPKKAVGISVAFRIHVLPISVDRAMLVPNLPRR
jgi:hypothetical protein